MAKEPFAVKLTSIWIGGFFFWIFKGFKGDLGSQFAEQYHGRNVWAGYFIALLGLIIIVYLLQAYN